MKKDYLGRIIFENRRKANLTQDAYASKYGVTGAAIFKFEEGHLRPSLDLWLKMAADAGISQRLAVLLLVKTKLPEEFQGHIDLQSAVAAEMKSDNAGKKRAKADYSKCKTREQIRQILDKDRTLPEGLRELLEDDELWVLYKPTGHEINVLRDTFSPIGKGTKVMFREALSLIREFAHPL
jgi:DNA-binding XRE family transcriptional regulator